MRKAQTGIPAIGDVDWGNHFCHFYRTAEDMAETLLPFFKVGLEANEACLWVTAEPFGKERALQSLNAIVEDLDRRITDGQIGIYDHSEWYELHGAKSRQDVVQVWVDAQADAAKRGYSGFRLTGNTAFLTADDWDDFMDYERAVRDAFRYHELIALCSYDSGKFDADTVLDVVQTHDFALARRRGDWEVIESASVKKSKDALAQLNAELETRITERTAQLTQALAQQRLLTAELSHRVKNTITSVQSIVDQSLRTQRTVPEARSAVRGRLAALGSAHDRLARVDWHGVKLSDLLETMLAPHGDRVHVELNGEVLTPRAALDLSLVFHELATNALKFGALSNDRGAVTVRAGRAGSGFELEWAERGGPEVGPAGQQGFGTRLIRQLVSHDLQGECELDFGRAGLTCTIRAPADEILVRKIGCAHGGLH